MRKLALAVVFGGSATFGASMALGISGCGNATLVQCRAEAVRFLPSDPAQVTPYDVQDLVGRLKTCEAPPAVVTPAPVRADAGAP